jgi:acyl-CoA thioester hydrolase
MTRASSVQVAVNIADGAMQMVSPPAFVNAVEHHLQ